MLKHDKRHTAVIAAILAANLAGAPPEVLARESAPEAHPSPMSQASPSAITEEDAPSPAGSPTLELEFTSPRPEAPLASPKMDVIRPHLEADTEPKTPPPLREVYPAKEVERGAFQTARKATDKPQHLESYDSVIQPQREPVIRRLYLTEKLIREHGRAYDYRSITYAELLEILKQLRKTEEKSKKQKRPN